MSTRLGSRLPVKKIGDDLKAETLTLLRMELGAGIAVARDDSGDRPAIIGVGHEVGAVARIEVIGVHEIGMQALRTQGNAGEQWMGLAFAQRVPTHMRDLQLSIGRRDAIDLAGDPAQALGDLVFAPTLGHELHADADAEERPTL